MALKKKQGGYLGQTSIIKQICCTPSKTRNENETKTRRKRNENKREGEKRKQKKRRKTNLENMVYKTGN